MGDRLELEQAGLEKLLSTNVYINPGVLSMSVMFIRCKWRAASGSEEVQLHQVRSAWRPCRQPRATERMFDPQAKN